MAYGYTIHHTEWLAAYAYTDGVTRPAAFDVLLYDDAADDVQHDDDIDAIDTEPDDGSYARHAAAVPADISVSTGALAARVDIDGVAIDLTDTTGEVDAWGIVWETQLADDGAATDHLMARGPLREREDLADYTGETSLAVGFEAHNMF